MGQADHPGEDTVEEKGDKGLAAGTDGEIGALYVGGQGQESAGNEQKAGGGMADHLLRVVDVGDEGGACHDEAAHYQVGGHAEHQQLAHGILGLLDFIGSQQLAG